MAIFEALADPTRRRILERLWNDGPLSVTEVADPLPISRQAVTRHLDVLEESGLIRSWREGRRRLHEVDPRPLREVEEWLRPYAEEWDRKLERLRRHLGGRVGGGPEGRRGGHPGGRPDRGEPSGAEEDAAAPEGGG